MSGTFDPRTLHEIKALADRVYARESFWQTSEMRLLGPAAPSSIEALSASLPAPLPPSYRAFLASHDGCIGFWPNFTLLGTTKETRDFIDAEIEDARETFAAQVAGDNGEVTTESIARFETPTDVTEKLYLPKHAVFGTNGGGEFFVFNEKVRDGDEFQVAHYTYDGGIYERYESFDAFLRATLASLEDRVRSKKYR